jgi:hypothetical protein
MGDAGTRGCLPETSGKQVVATPAKSSQRRRAPRYGLELGLAKDRGKDKSEAEGVIDSTPDCVNRAAVP